MQKNILIVGCGDVGEQTGLRLKSLGCRVFGVTRTTEKTLPFPCFNADVSDAVSIKRCIDDIAVDIHYVVYTVAPGSRTEQAYQAAYPNGVSNILECINAQVLLGFLLVTSTAVYHQQQGEWVDENSLTQPVSFSGKALLDAEAVLANACVKGVAIRFGGIYGPGRERMLRKVMNGCEINYDIPVYTNRIHRDDCVGMLCFIIEKIDAGSSVESCYVGVDSHPAPENEVLVALANLLDVDLPVHNENLRIASQNKRCRNDRVRALGYRFVYEGYVEGYRSIVELRG